VQEAGGEFFTFRRLPSSQWKCVATTNARERINEERRRRTKTQSRLPRQDRRAWLLFGLLRSGQVKLRALVGRQAMEMGANSRRIQRADGQALKLLSPVDRHDQ
jgi:putative transposase